MSAKHTPGPWKASRPTKTITRNADIWTADVDSRDLLVAADVRGIGQTECVANARLISAAPDLLEALEDLLLEIDESTHEDGNKRAASCVRGEVCFQSTLEGARAAIAKAKGGAS